MEQIENKNQYQNKNNNQTDVKDNNTSVSTNTNTKTDQLDLKQLITKIDNRVKTKVYFHILKNILI